jgi:hypothetical protein
MSRACSPFGLSRILVRGRDLEGCTMSEDPDPRYVLRRITPSEWVINDRRFPSNDPRHIVACVYEFAETEVEVVWVRDLPLASRYCNAMDVLEDLERMQETSRATRPVPIPHLPPLVATQRR